MQTVILRFNLIPLLCTGLMINSQELAEVNKVLRVSTSQKQGACAALCCALQRRAKSSTSAEEGRRAGGQNELD